MRELVGSEAHRVIQHYKENIMNFGDALFNLNHGHRVCREGWNGKGMWINMQRPDEHSKMTHPYLYIEYPEGHPSYPKGSRIPWLASQTDILADDWLVLSDGAI